MPSLDNLRSLMEEAEKSYNKKNNFKEKIVSLFNYNTHEFLSINKEIQSLISEIYIRMSEDDKTTDSLIEAIRKLEINNNKILERMANDDKTTDSLIEATRKLEINNEKILERMSEDDKTTDSLIEAIKELEISNQKTLERMSGDDKTTNSLIEAIRKLELSFENIMIRLSGDDITTNTLISDISSIKAKLKDVGLNIDEKETFNMLDKRTTSQAGEDCILAYITAVLKIPFHKCSYLDLGANRPKEMNNTYFFYKQGARGVLVEANEELIPELKFYRSEDIIINKCISNKSGKIVDFNILNIDGVSTADKDSIEEMQLINKSIYVKSVKQVESISINDIFEKYFTESPVIMNVDIEGKELEILNSVDFSKYRPLIIIIEMIPYSTSLLVGVKNQDILTFMDNNNYIEFAFTGINSIFIDRKRLSESNLGGELWK